MTCLMADAVASDALADAVTDAVADAVAGAMAYCPGASSTARMSPVGVPSSIVNVSPLRL